MEEKKIIFPVFDYQGLPIVFGFFIFIGLYVIPDDLIFGIVIAIFLGAFPMSLFLFHRKYIIRIDSSDYIIFGQEFTKKINIKDRKIPISDLFYTTYKPVNPDGNSYRLMEIKENNQTIIIIGTEMRIIVSFLVSMNYRN